VPPPLFCFMEFSFLSASMLVFFKTGALQSIFPFSHGFLSNVHRFHETRPKNGLFFFLSPRPDAETSWGSLFPFGEMSFSANIKLTLAPVDLPLSLPRTTPFPPEAQDVVPLLPRARLGGEHEQV